MTRKLESDVNQLLSWLKIWNLYGPTETNAVTWFNCSFESNEGKPTNLDVGVPIGRSYPNCSTIILYHNNILNLRGKSVGAGYLGLNSKTREKFIYDNLNNDGESKMYNSGDKARYLNTGDIEYLGRNDDQVKINGQRVELGAVESGLLSCKGVTGCAVIVTGDQSNKSLAAFVVMSQDAKILSTERSLKEQVSKKVARHEVPHRIVVVDKIPLNTSGKADRNALKAIVQNGGSLRLIEKTNLRSVGRSNSLLLVQDQIRHLNIFPDSEKESIWEMGATSLMAMNLSESLRKNTGITVSMEQLLKAGTAEGIARILDEGSLKSDHQHEQLSVTEFCRIRRFKQGHNSTTIIFSSFGFLGETVLPLVAALQNDYNVCVCEFVVSETPRLIAEKLHRDLTDIEMENLTLVVAHSAGGVFAFELMCILHNQAITFCMLDCYVPPLGRFSEDQLKRFCMKPFLELTNSEDITNIPNSYLDAIFVQLLKKTGFNETEAAKLASLYGSEEMLGMVQKLNDWARSGRINCNWIFVKSTTSSEDVVAKWEQFFSQGAHEATSTRDHFQMLKDAGQILKNMI
jgi:hypothetical protein